MSPATIGTSNTGGNGDPSPDTADSTTGIKGEDAAKVGAGAAAIAALKGFLAKQAFEKTLSKVTKGRVLPGDVPLGDKVKAAVDIAKSLKGGSLPGLTTREILGKAVRRGIVVDILFSAAGSAGHGTNPSQSNADRFTGTEEAFAAGKIIGATRSTPLTEAEISSVTAVLTGEQAQSFFNGLRVTLGDPQKAAAVREALILENVELPNSLGADP